MALGRREGSRGGDPGAAVYATQETNADNFSAGHRWATGYGGVLKYMSRTLDFCTRLLTIWRARTGLLGETGAAPSQALQGPSTSSPGNQRKLHIEKCQETIGQCLIRHWPILLDAIMLTFLPLSFTLLAVFYYPSVSHQPPPVHSGRASSHRGPRSRPHPGPQRPGFTRQDHHFAPQAEAPICACGSATPRLGCFLRRLPVRKLMLS